MSHGSTLGPCRFADRVLPALSTRLSTSASLRTFIFATSASFCSPLSLPLPMNHLPQWKADVTKGLQDGLAGLSFMADLHGAFCSPPVAPLLLCPPWLHTPVWINLAKLDLTTNNRSNCHLDTTVPLLQTVFNHFIESIVFNFCFIFCPG